MINIQQAEKIFKKNFIGSAQLEKISRKMGIPSPFSLGKIPVIKLSEKEAKKIAKNFILILGVPKNSQGNKLTINSMRLFFGINSDNNEPCFYNQDWYIKEKFASNNTLNFKWYLIRKNILKGTRAEIPQKIISRLPKKEGLPSAILATFTFFSYWFLNKGEKLWKNDFIWCKDKDNNGDGIYVGRYQDPKKINKNGFNIHRHLSLRPCYGAISAMEMD